jgi:hypothetical protein
MSESGSNEGPASAGPSLCVERSGLQVSGEPQDQQDQQDQPDDSTTDVHDALLSWGVVHAGSQALTMPIAGPHGLGPLRTSGHRDCRLAHCIPRPHDDDERLK